MRTVPNRVYARLAVNVTAVRLCSPNQPSCALEYIVDVCNSNSCCHSGLPLIATGSLYAAENARFPSFGLRLLPPPTKQKLSGFLIVGELERSLLSQLQPQ